MPLCRPVGTLAAPQTVSISQEGVLSGCTGALTCSGTVSSADYNVTGTKSMTGHLLGGAGALESMATLLALYHRKVPPTINLDNPEADLGADIATKVRDLPRGDLAAVNNSFGFGGHNVAVAFTNAYATGA